MQVRMLTKIAAIMTLVSVETQATKAGNTCRWTHLILFSF